MGGDPAGRDVVDGKIGTSGDQACADWGVYGLIFFKSFSISRFFCSRS
ncbi:MAG: hypothetical protein MZV64_64510 [Ignavibacteriales bacterium]|nr:hypothetical protein [Ignavibacteriales bacterium]